MEGNLAGSRAARLEQKRRQEVEDFERRKKQITEQTSTASSAAWTSIEGKFATGGTATFEEKSLQNRTIGLVSATDFRRAAAASSSTSSGNTLQDVNPSFSTGGIIGDEDEAHKSEIQGKKEEKARKKKSKAKKKLLSTLSFVCEEDELETSAAESQFPTLHKDSSVDTSYLPDRKRDERTTEERARLEQEWKQLQDAAKQEKLEITYSYWDGSGHRRSVVCLKGETIGGFLERARLDLCREFREMSNISADALIYVKEDLILPQDLTFYELIVTKARGKSGPLFHFDVHDDVRVGAIDARVEKDESHPGKVVERRWYERNKHIFPASRWEVFDPSKDYGSYSIKDRNHK